MKSKEVFLGGCGYRLGIIRLLLARCCYNYGCNHVHLPHFSMRRYYYENWLAKVLLMFSTCHTIAVAWFVLSKLKEVDTDQTDRNHETIHAMQWTEVTMSVGTIILSLVLLFGISAWWMLVSPFAYYVWYLIEWLCKLPFGNAYRSISLELEAYNNESDSSYVENRHLFCGWLKFVFKGRIIYLRK